MRRIRTQVRSYTRVCRARDLFYAFVGCLCCGFQLQYEESECGDENQSLVGVTFFP